jgi:hypothetical protein
MPNRFVIRQDVHQLHRGATDSCRIALAMWPQFPDQFEVTFSGVTILQSACTDLVRSEYARDIATALDGTYTLDRIVPDPSWMGLVWPTWAVVVDPAPNGMIYRYFSDACVTVDGTYDKLIVSIQRDTVFPCLYQVIAALGTGFPAPAVGLSQFISTGLRFQAGCPYPNYLQEAGNPGWGGVCIVRPVV